MHKLSTFKSRPRDDFSAWLSKFRSKLLQTYCESCETAYDSLEQVREDEAYSQWEIWTKTDRSLEENNWVTFKKWDKKSWNSEARRRNLCKAALNLWPDRLSVLQQISRILSLLRQVYERRGQDHLPQGRLTPRLSEAPHWYQVVHCWRPQRETRLEVEALDKRDYAPKLKYKSKTGCTKSSGIDPTAAVTSTSDSFCEHCLRPGHTKSD